MRFCELLSRDLWSQVDYCLHLVFITEINIMPTVWQMISWTLSAFVDKLVCNIMAEETNIEELSQEIKFRLLNIPVLDVIIDDQRSPLMIAVGQTTASLYKCFSGTLRKIKYPSFE